MHQVDTLESALARWCHIVLIVTAAQVFSFCSRAEGMIARDKWGHL